ncbi:hypothetical protein R3I94_008753 [Phoxinus phoxinus]
MLFFLLTAASRSEHRSEGGTKPSKSTYPMSTTKFQRKVFAMLFDLKDQLQQVVGILDPGRSTTTLKKMDSESDLKVFDENIKDVDKKSICVQQLSRIGGSSIRDCVNKVMNRMMSNALMAKFNMRGGGQLEKKPFKATPLYHVIQDAVKRWSPNSTESEIDAAMAEHLKHAPGRAGGGGYKK